MITVTPLSCIRMRWGSGRSRLDDRNSVQCHWPNTRYSWNNPLRNCRDFIKNSKMDLFVGWLTFWILRYVYVIFRRMKPRGFSSFCSVRRLLSQNSICDIKARINASGIGMEHLLKSLWTKPFLRIYQFYYVIMGSCWSLHQAFNAGSIQHWPVIEPIWNAW